MLLTDNDIHRLDKIFSGLWGNRFGVNGSWGASTHGYHPTFIRRHGLLLKGTTTLKSIYVLYPADCKVTPEYGDPRAHCNVMPKVDGEIIHIYQTDDGIWWDAVRAEIPKMEEELQITMKTKDALEAQERQKKYDGRSKKLSMAALAFKEVSKNVR